MSHVGSRPKKRRYNTRRWMISIETTLFLQFAFSSKKSYSLPPTDKESTGRRDRHKKWHGKQILMILLVFPSNNLAKVV